MIQLGQIQRFVNILLCIMITDICCYINDAIEDSWVVGGLETKKT